MFATKTILTARKADAVWNLLTNLENWNRWNPGIRSVTMGMPLSLKSKGAIFFRQGWRTRFTVTDYVPGSSYTISFKNLLADVHIHRYIGYHNHKTTITNELWAEGILSDLWWALFSSTWIKMLEAESSQLKQFIEQGALMNAEQ